MCDVFGTLECDHISKNPKWKCSPYGKTRTICQTTGTSGREKSHSQDIYIFSNMIKPQKAYVENWCHLDTDCVEEMKIQSQRESECSVPIPYMFKRLQLPETLLTHPH